MRYLIVSVSLLLFSACSVLETKPSVVNPYEALSWVAPEGKTDSDFQRDNVSCERDAHTARNAQGYYFSCMKANGYVLRKGT